VTGILDQLLAAGPRVVLAVVGLVVFVEDALFVGFVIPGESAAILGGVAAQMRVFDKRRSRLDDAQDFLARRGGMAVLLGCWATVEKAIGRDGALIAVAVVLLALVVWKVREHRASSREPRSGHPAP